MSSDLANMWTKTCESWCQKTGVQLIFVNTENYSFGYQDSDGALYHIFADELAEIIHTTKENEK